MAVRIHIEIVVAGNITTSMQSMARTADRVTLTELTKTCAGPRPRREVGFHGETREFRVSHARKRPPSRLSRGRGVTYAYGPLSWRRHCVIVSRASGSAAPAAGPWAGRGPDLTHDCALRSAQSGCG